MEHVDEDYLENISVADAGLLLANKPSSTDRRREGSRGKDKAHHPHPPANVVVAFQSEHDVLSSSSPSPSDDIGARNRSLMERTRARDMERAQARLNKGDLVEIEKLLEIEDIVGEEEEEVVESYDISGDHWPLETSSSGGGNSGDGINRSVSPLKSIKPRKNIVDSSSGTLTSLLYLSCYYDLY